MSYGETIPAGKFSEEAKNKLAMFITPALKKMKTDFPSGTQKDKYEMTGVPKMGHLLATGEPLGVTSKETVPVITNPFLGP